MTGETAEKESGWTVDTLRAHIAVRFDDLNILINERDVRYGQRFVAQQEALAAALAAAEKAVAAALLAADRAVTKAELASEKRFENVNEFRAALADQSNTLMTRNEYTAAHVALEDKIDRLEKWQASQGGGENARDTRSRTSLVYLAIGVSGFFSFIAVSLGVVTLILRLTGH